MSEIKIEKLSENDLNSKGVFNWPIWQKETSTFDWYYDATEECYLLAGKVIVTPENSQPVEFGTGDFVTFPQGMKCVWEIKEPVKKHYNFK